MTIRHLTFEDASQFHTVRLEGLRTFPHAFGENADTFEKLTEQQVADYMAVRTHNGGFILGAFDDNERLLGVVGLILQASEKIRHTAILWGFYVIAEARGEGIAKVLLTVLISEAKSCEDVEQIKLTVESGNEIARGLYEAFGFKRFGTEPRVLKIDGNYYDEDHMLLRL